MANAIGREVQLVLCKQINGSSILEGNLVAFADNNYAITSEKDGVVIIKDHLVESLVVKDWVISTDLATSGSTKPSPTLMWHLQTSGPGEQQIEVMYNTTGLSWIANYIVTLNESASQLDFRCWFTINNTSDKCYYDSRIWITENSSSSSTTPPSNFACRARPRAARAPHSPRARRAARDTPSIPGYRDTPRTTSSIHVLMTACHVITPGP